MNINKVARDLRKELENADREIVSIALFGQPGAGKSSLINKLVGKKVAEVGVETDKTKDAARYCSNGLAFVDLPGYGSARFPKDTFFDRFQIPQFDLFLCVTSGKLHDADTAFFQDLTRRGKVCIYVVNKHDDLWEEGKSTTDLEQAKRDDIAKHVGMPVKVVFTSCKNNTGLGELESEIRNRLDGAKKERWARSAKAYSEEFLAAKKKSCERYVTIASLAAAANGINPIPGADVAIDIAMLTKLSTSIREAYGLSGTTLDDMRQSTAPVVVRLANDLLKYATKEGAMLLAKRFVGRKAVQTFFKYVPVIGQMIAAGLGYTITSNIGHSYLNDCHELAETLLQDQLRSR